MTGECRRGAHLSWFRQRRGGRPSVWRCLLGALLPPNVHAARVGLTLGGRPATPLVVRLPMQLFWIGLLIRVAVG